MDGRVTPAHGNCWPRQSTKFWLNFLLIFILIPCLELNFLQGSRALWVFLCQGRIWPPHNPPFWVWGLNSRVLHIGPHFHFRFLSTIFFIRADFESVMTRERFFLFSFFSFLSNLSFIYFKYGGINEKFSPLFFRVLSDFTTTRERPASCWSSFKVSFRRFSFK